MTVNLVIHDFNFVYNNIFFNNTNSKSGCYVNSAKIIFIFSFHTAVIIIVSEICNPSVLILC